MAIATMPGDEKGKEGIVEIWNDLERRHHHGVGVNRRELLQVGYSGLLGIGVPSIWAGQAAGSAASSRKARAVVLVFLTGAPSHLDTFDLKPEAPAEIRGDFKTIATRAPGVDGLDDLEVHGLLSETLVVIVGEFGRTPKIGQSSTNDASQSTGRDHWAGVFSAVFAGGGVRAGRVIGKSDKIAAYPATRGYYPADLGATIYHALGVGPASNVRDQLGRPLELNRGELIAPLFDSSLS